MSANQEKTWLVCYDIRDKKRLARVHKRLRKEGCTVQYSAFSVRANDRQMEKLLAALEGEIDPREDDIRAYHLPARCNVWMLGCQSLPEGIALDSESASRLLLVAPKDSCEGLSIV